MNSQHGKGQGNFCVRKERALAFALACCFAMLSSCSQDYDIHDAISHGDIDAVKSFIKAGQLELEKSGKTPLQGVIREDQCSSEMILLLIRSGANLAVVDQSGETVLFKIVRYRYPDAHRFVAAAIEHGVNVNFQNPNGDTVLHLVVRDWPDRRIMELLLTHGADPKLKNNQGVAALDEVQLASREKFLLWGGIKPTNLDVAAIAVWKGDIEAITAMEKFPHPDARIGCRRSTLLMLATMNSKVDVMKLLLAKGASVNARSKIGFTSLHYAIHADESEGMHILLKQPDVAVDARDNVGRTPLHYAAMSANHDKISALVNAGADLSSRDRAGFTAYDLAKKMGYSGVVLKMLAPSQGQ